MVLELGELTYNLFQVQQAAKCGNPRGNLILNGFGNVYCNGNFLGYTWTVINAFRESFFGYKEDKFELFEVLKKTTNAFKQHSKKAHERDQTYRWNFYARGNGIEIQEKDKRNIKDARDFLINWLKGTSPLLDLIKKDKSFAERIQSVFYDINIFEKELSKRIDLSAHLIQLEYLLHGDIPVEALAALSRDGVLSSENELAAGEWISKINALYGILPIRLFDQALRELVKCLGHEAQLDKLERNLRALGCKLFEEIDNKHIIKYHYPTFIEKKLNESVGKIFNVKKEIVELPGSTGGRFKAYLIKSESKGESKVVITGSTKSDLSFRNYENSWGIDGPTVIERDPNGCFIIVEQLVNPISEYKWTSNQHKLTMDDAKIAKVLANLIYSRKTTHPRGIDPKDLMFSNDELKTTKPYEREEGFNFLAWEEFCVKSANGNKWIFDYLVNVSKLNIRPEWLYLTSIFKNKLNSKNKIEKFPDQAPRKIIVETAAKLEVKAKSIASSCKGSLYEWNKELKKANTQLTELIADRIIYYYDQFGSATTTPWDKLEELVVKDIKFEIETANERKSCVAELLKQNSRFDEKVLKKQVDDNFAHYYELSIETSKIAELVINDIKSEKEIPKLFKSEYYSKEFNEIQENEKNAERINTEKRSSRDVQ